MDSGCRYKKIGILGGSFDPIHMGHINIAKSAYKEFGLDEVWFVPAGHSPHKEETDMAPAKARAEMVSLAIQGEPRFRLSEIELETDEKSYTYLTLTKLKERYPDMLFYFIMGADSLDYFEHWSHPEIICEKAVILAAVRDDMELAEICDKINQLKRRFDARIYPIKGGRTDISSTEIRNRIQAGVSDLSMVPPKTAGYIRNNHLYES